MLIKMDLLLIGEKIGVIKRLNEAVKRNIARFPEEFRFQLTAKETESLRSQFATLENPNSLNDSGISCEMQVLTGKGFTA